MQFVGIGIYSGSQFIEISKTVLLQFRLMNIAITSLVGISLSPLISLIAGILILIVPRLLNFIVAIYLIIIGLVGVFHL
jgi:Protein of unknown function (DUF3096)